MDLEELFYCLAQESPTLKERGPEYKTGIYSKLWEPTISRDHEMEMGCSIAGPWDLVDLNRDSIAM